ncbi:MAG: hypothetical protein ACC653_06705 [Gammaproteobacteria bacterium]
MIFRTFVFILTLPFVFSSCAYLDAQRDDVDSLITKWLSEQEYDKALDTLSEVKTVHPQYFKLMLRKKEITKQSNKFVAKTIKQAQFFIKESKWEDAYTVYDFALSRVSEDKSLNSSYKRYLNKRQIYIDKLKHKLLIHNANVLIKILPVQKKISQAIKETSVEQKKYESLEQQAIETIDSLVTCSSNSLKLKKIKVANLCIGLALKLKPSKEITKLLKLNQQKISKLTAGKKQKKQRAKSSSYSRALKEYKAAFDKDDLITANKKLTALLAENKDNYELIKLKTELDETINKKIKIGIESGRILYSKGNIKLALDKWQRLQKLDPENIELNSHISRAERVLRKLRNLTNKEDVNNKTGG